MFGRQNYQIFMENSCSIILQKYYPFLQCYYLICISDKLFVLATISLTMYPLIEAKSHKAYPSLKELQNATMKGRHHFTAILPVKNFSKNYKYFQRPFDIISINLVPSFNCWKWNGNIISSVGTEPILSVCPFTITSHQSINNRGFT